MLQRPRYTSLVHVCQWFTKLVFTDYGAWKGSREGEKVHATAQQNLHTFQGCVFMWQGETQPALLKPEIELQRSMILAAVAGGIPRIDMIA